MNRCHRERFILFSDYLLKPQHCEKTELYKLIEENNPVNDSLIDGLIKKGTDINKGYGNWTPLHIAVFKNNITAIHMLLAAGGSVNGLFQPTLTRFSYPYRLETNSSLLHVTAALCVKKSTMHTLLKSGVLINLKDNNEDTALDKAIRLYCRKNVIRRKVTSSNMIGTEMAQNQLVKICMLVSAGMDMRLNISDNCRDWFDIFLFINGQWKVIELLRLAGYKCTLLKQNTLEYPNIERHIDYDTVNKFYRLNSWKLDSLATLSCSVIRQNIRPNCVAGIDNLILPTRFRDMVLLNYYNSSFR